MHDAADTAYQTSVVHPFVQAVRSTVLISFDSCPVSMTFSGCFMENVPVLLPIRFLGETAKYAETKR